MKKLFALVLVLAMIFSFASCAKTEEPAATDETQPETQVDSYEAVKGKTATLILKNLTNPFFITVKEGAEACAAEYGIELTVLAPLKADSNEEQSQMAEQAVVNQTDILVMCPSDSEGIVPAMQTVRDAGIPIINLNTKIGGDEVFWESFVAIENYDAGYNTVKRLIEMMDGEGTMFVIEGVTGAQTSIDRTKGALDAVAETNGKVEVVAQQSADYNRATGMNVVQNLLQAHPDVKAIYCCNDEMALGAIEAIQAAGKTGDILVAGCDANADAQAALKEGTMALSCNSQPYVQGYEAVKAAVRVLAGETVEERIVTDMKVVGKEDLA